MGECVTGPGGIGSDATSQQRALRKLRGRVERVEEFESRIVGGSTSSTLGMLRLFDCHLSRLAGSSFWQSQHSPVGRGPQPALSPAGAGGGPRAPGVRGHITLERCGHEKPRTFQTGPRYPSCHPEEPQARKDLRISRPRVQRISHFLSKHTVFAPIIAQPLHYRTNSLLGCRPFCHPHLCFHAHSRVDLHF